LKVELAECLPREAKGNDDDDNDDDDDAFFWIAGVSIENAWAGVIMYLSYFVLFLKLFVDKYVYGKQVNMGIPGGGGKGAASKKAR
jgi:hypothetical protein